MKINTGTIKHALGVLALLAGGAPTAFAYVPEPKIWDELSCENENLMRISNSNSHYPLTTNH